ncbi:MAG: hypothetical protein JO028_15425 [Acidobacteriaceae bacterium]|nr:hypothetical protein [Acidobacteriaceae bacterium]
MSEIIMLEMQTTIKFDLSLFILQRRKFMDWGDAVFLSSHCLQVCARCRPWIFQKTARNQLHSGLHLTLKLPSRSHFLAAVEAPKQSIQIK